jgi:PAS domain S-box-containing protein
MKKKLFIASGLVCLIFLAGGIYIITTIETSTTELDNLIRLHQVEILREHLLIQIKNVQSDLYLMGTRYEQSPQTVMANIDRLSRGGVTCFDCHHRDRVVQRLRNMNVDIEFYKGSVSKILAMQGDRAGIMKEGDKAFQTTQKLFAQVKDMVHIANNKLAGKTKASLKNMYGSKTILYVLVILTPFVAAGFCFFYIREFVKPIKLLLKATRKLESGDLDYKVEGLKDEFGEVATSFNAMAASLKHNMLGIQESEKRYRTLFESAADAIFIIEAEGEKIGDIVDANQAAAKMHGYTLDEMLTLNLIKDLDVPEETAKAPDRVKRIMNGEWVKAEIEHRKKDGTIFAVEISAGLLEYMGQKYILAIDRDISKRKGMEKMVLQSQLEWEDTFNTITDMITIHDKDFRIIRANKAAEKILGLPFLGATDAKCYQYYHGQDHPPENCASCGCFKTGRPVSVEMYEPHLDRFLEIRAMPRFGDDDHLVGLIHVIRDITEKKKVEESLQRTEQLKLVGEWSAELAHEIKNPLAGIKGSMEVLLQEPDIAGEDKALIEKSVDEIRRIEVLIKSLLNFAKPPRLQLLQTDINDLLDKTLSFSINHPTMVDGAAMPIKIIKDFDPNLPETMADPMQLQQVFLNLMLNAIEAMPEGGALAVKTSYDERMNAVNIAIADTGNGIEKSMLEQIFQPFFTTKRKGSGLGLAVTRRLIEQHGGDVYVESTPDQGTVFNITLRTLPELKEKSA